MTKAVIITLLSLLFLSLEINCQEAALHVSNGSTNKEYCLVYNSSWTNISDSLSTAVEYELVNLTSTLLCNGSGPIPAAVTVKGKVLVVMRGECTFVEKALNAQQLGAAALLVASTITMSPPAANESEYESVHIPLALMRYRDFRDAQQVFGDVMLVKMYAPRAATVDVSIIVMLIIAVFTVAMGGYWSGACERERLSREPSVGGGCEEKTDSGDLSLYSPLKVVIFVALMCVMLVLMYFFYKWLVYVIIAIFCLASATALFSCLDAVMDLVGCGMLSFSVRGKTLSVRSLLLAAVCISISVVWAVYRNEDRWIWILQDLLGIAFCLNFMKTITLSNFKICVILLGLLLLYDVFFVFITPFLTPNGESIMVQVALGPDAAGGEKGNTVEVPAEPAAPYEKLPVVMRVPRFSSWAQNLCGMQFSILGYGDIIVPGLLVAYCSRFDVWTNSPKKMYFLSCCTAYLCGMVVTFVAMLTSKMGQPALLYLVPFTLASSALLAWGRGEFRQFWTGTTYEVLESSREPLLPEEAADYSAGGRIC